MKHMSVLLGTCLVCCTLGWSQTLIETEPVKELRPTGTLGTRRYSPRGGESPFYNKLSEEERFTGSILGDYDIQTKKGYVSWYGIVRGISKTGEGRWRLLLEHKFFDGMTDLHIMVVDISGSGDFYADFNTAELFIPALALVRIYGTIAEAQGGFPVIEAEYVRVWPWLTFTFMDLMRIDRTNQKWKALRSAPGLRIYMPYPNENYYRALLGDPTEYGLSLKDH